MSFLTLDTEVVPVKAESVTAGTTYVGSIDRAFSGALRRDVRAIKRNWRMTTPPLTPYEYGKLRALIEHSYYDRWTFDTDLTSEKYAIDAEGTPTYQILSATAGDGTALTSGTVKVGSGCLQTYSTRTSATAENQFDAAVRDAEGTPASDYTAVDSAIISTDTTNYWQGTQSAKVVTSATVNSVKGGLYAAATWGGTSGAKALGSVWVKGTTGSVDVYVKNQASAATSATVTVDLSDGLWHRVLIEGVVALSVQPMRLYVVESVADSNMTFYCDGFSLVEDSLDTYSQWMDPTWAGSSVSYDSANVVNGCADFMIAAWVKWQMTDDSTSEDYAICLEDDGGGYVRLSYDANTTSLKAYVYTGTVTAHATYTVALASIARTWNHVAVVVVDSPAAGENPVELYLNGVNVASGTNASWDGTSGITGAGSLRVGNSAGGGQDTETDNLVVARTAAGVSLIGYLAEQSAIAPHPYHTAAGDLFAGINTTVSARITSEKIMGATEPGVGWENCYREVEIEIEEV